MKTILLRADGSKNIGMGHLSRCCLIANYLFKEKNIQSIIITRNDVATKNFLSNKCKSSIIHYIDENLSLEDELDSVGGFVDDGNISLILLDLLEVNITDKYISGLYKNKLPISAVTDDSEYRVIDVNLILNGNPNQDKFDYSNESGKYLLGPSYFIMDSAYAEYTRKDNVLNGRVLLTLGGSDHNNLIFNVLNVLIDNPSVTEVIIITSKSTGYFSELEKVVNSQSKDITIYNDVPTLKSYWSKCDLAITAGGNTLFERIASGIPGATICQLPRQMEISNKFESLGVNRNLGYGPDIKYEILKKNINDFLEDKKKSSGQIERCREIVSGKGLKYFVDELCELIGED